MSVNLPIGLSVIERIVGIILIIIGAIVINSSLTPPTGDISHFANLFTLLGIVVVIVGIFLIVTKTE